MNGLYKIIFGILILFLLSINIQDACANEVKFIQITDSHFAEVGGNYTQRDVEHSKIYLEKTIKDINSIKNLDFVAFTGDNIDQPNSEDLKLFLDIVNKLKVPYYMVIGNHEVFKAQGLSKKKYMKIVRKYSKWGACKPRGANYVFHKKGFVFIVVDGAKEVIPGPAGYYKKDTLKWFDKQLTKYKNKKVIILQHFPIIPPSRNRTHITYKVADYKAVLKKHSNIIAIVSGHYHVNGEVKKDGIYHVSTPALVEPPNNYKVIEIVHEHKGYYQIFTQLRHAE